MEKFIVRGPCRLKGQVEISGSKNASLPILAATLLFDKPIELKNLPKVKDVDTMLSLLKSLGLKIKINNKKKTVKIYKSKKIKTLSFTGFDGGRAKKLSDYNIHVDSLNYGVVENLHHACMNIISQFIRNNVSNLFEIKKYKF